MPRKEVNKVQLAIREFGAEVCDVLGDAETAQRWLKAFHDGLVYGIRGRSAFADRLRDEADGYIHLRAELGRRGGLAKSARKKNQDAPASRPLPGTSSGNGEALNDEGATAPAGQPFEARQAAPGAQPESASGKPSTPAPVSAHGNAAEGGLLMPWYGPAAGKTFDQESTRADARIREDRDASATVRAQIFDGDAATREGAEAAISGFATSPSDIQKRPGKSATTPYCVEDSMLIHDGGSERGAGGTDIDAVRRSPGAKVPEPRLRYGSARNVLMTASEMAKLASEFGDVRQITEELSDYLLLHPNKYRSHYAALRNWCRRRIREGRNPDGTKMTQGDRLARHFAIREKEILDGKDAEEE